MMSSTYTPLTADDADNLTEEQPRASSGALYPPQYHDLEAQGTSGYQNYVHLSTKHNINTTLHINADLPPAFGRFESDEERDTAKNVTLKGAFVNARIYLRGKAKAKLELKGTSLFRRVVHISNENGREPPTQFSLEAFSQGGNCFIVVPESFSGLCSGRIKLSPLLAHRSTVLVSDESDRNKTRYSVAPLARSTVSAPSTASAAKEAAGDQAELPYSSISCVPDGALPNGHAHWPCRNDLLVTTEQEYMEQYDQMVQVEGEEATRYEDGNWLLKFAFFQRRVWKYGTKGDRVAFTIVGIAFLFIALIFATALYYGIFADD